MELARRSTNINEHHDSRLLRRCRSLPTVVLCHRTRAMWRAISSCECTGPLRSQGRAECGATSGRTSPVKSSPLRLAAAPVRLLCEPCEHQELTHDRGGDNTHKRAISLSARPVGGIALLVSGRPADDLLAACHNRHDTCSARGGGSSDAANATTLVGTKRVSCHAAALMSRYAGNTPRQRGRQDGDGTADTDASANDEY